MTVTGGHKEVTASILIKAVIHTDKIFFI